MTKRALFAGRKKEKRTAKGRKNKRERKEKRKRKGKGKKKRRTVFPLAFLIPVSFVFSAYFSLAILLTAMMTARTAALSTAP